MRKCAKPVERNEELGSLSIFLSKLFPCDHTIHQTFWLGIGSRSRAWLLCTTVPGPNSGGVCRVNPVRRRRFLLQAEEWL